MSAERDNELQANTFEVTAKSCGALTVTRVGQVTSKKVLPLTRSN
jgi:hypothetical protein